MGCQVAYCLSTAHALINGLSWNKIDARVWKRRVLLTAVGMNCCKCILKWCVSESESVSASERIRLFQLPQPGSWFMHQRPYYRFNLQDPPTCINTLPGPAVCVCLFVAIIIWLVCVIIHMKMLHKDYGDHCCTAGM